VGLGGVVVAGAVVVVGRTVCVTAGGFVFTRSGKSFGASAAHVQRTASEIRTAIKIRFSI
jgi:hypothetical protein